MEDIIIPGWVWGLFSIMIIAWLIRLTFMAFRADKDQGVADARDIRILNDIGHLDVKLDSTKKDFHESLDRLEKRFEKFEDRMATVFDRVLDLLNKVTR